MKYSKAAVNLNRNAFVVVSFRERDKERANDDDKQVINFV